MRAFRAPVLIVTLAGCGGEVADSVSTPAACESCEIELRSIATLDFSNTPFMPAFYASLEELSDGTFVVVDFARDGEEILHFSRSGSYIDAHLRTGRGPGEALTIRHLLAVGDSLVVIDEGRARCTVLGPAFEYGRDFECYGNTLDAERVAGSLFLTGTGPLGLVEVGWENGQRQPARLEGVPVMSADYYASIAADTAGVWYVAHPSEYRLSHWRPGEANPSRVIERHPDWWQRGEPFLATGLPAGVRSPTQSEIEEWQTLSGPVLFNIGVSDGLVWTASYIHTVINRPYIDFLTDWLNEGLQGDVRVILEALTPEGELVASTAFDSIAPPRFTAGGVIYTIDKVAYGTTMTVYRPEVVYARR